MVESLDLLRDTGWKGEWGRSLLALAWCRQPDHNPEGGSWPEALTLYREAEQLLAEADPPLNRDHADALYGQGWCRQPDQDPEGDWEEARRLYERAVGLYRSLGHSERFSDALHGLAWCSRPDFNPKGDWERALAAFEEAGRVQGVLKGSYGETSYCHRTARSLERDADTAGNWNGAARLYRRAAKIHKEKGEDLGFTYLCIGRCIRPDNNPEGSWDEALAWYARAFAAFTTEGELWGQADSIELQAWCRRPDQNPEGDWKRAAALYAEALRLISYPGSEGYFAGQRADRQVALAYCLCEGDWTKAGEAEKKLLRQALEAYRQLNKTELVKGIEALLR
jgi:tetratricopeptide (TPR) repeat protein